MLNPFNAIPGLKVNQTIHFSCTEIFFAAFVLCSLSLFKLKTEGQTFKQNLTAKFKTLIKILSYLDLAYLGFEQPAQALRFYAWLNLYIPN